MVSRTMKESFSPLLQMWKLSLGEVKSLAQGHRARKLRPVLGLILTPWLCCLGVLCCVTWAAHLTSLSI